MFFPNFLTFILETPSLFLQSRQRENTLETPTLSRHRSTEEKEDRHLHFLINYVQEEKKKFFQTSKGGSKDLCYSSEPVYSPWDEPNEKEKYNISEPLHRRTHVG